MTASTMDVPDAVDFGEIPHPAETPPPFSDLVDLDYEADLCGNIEQALKALQGYGVMALELIQNADDAGARRLTFDARDDALLVWNDAVFSRCSLQHSGCDWEREADDDGVRRQCNFHAIRKMGGRSKIAARNQIGRFGIGFVSVYQITDTPIIRSVGVEFKLNPRTGKVRRANVTPAEGTEFELPWAFERSQVRDALNAAVAPRDVADRMVGEITAALPSSVLFLRHLERVEVRRGGRTVAAVDINRTARGLDLHLHPSGRIEQWIILSRSASDIIARKDLKKRYPGLDELGRSPLVDIAVPVGDETPDGLLYAYLPTRQATGMPLHVNADFFPHASRKDIVLDGEGHERYWNEALLAAAAAIVAENFTTLRDLLGARRLWSLGAAAMARAKDGAFGEFWKSFSSASRACASVLTIDGTWKQPADVRSAPREMDDREQNALASVGLSILNPSLRAYWNPLHDALVGVRQLRLPDIVTQLAWLPADTVRPANPHLRSIWSAVSTMLEVRGTKIIPTPAGVLNQLSTARFLLDRDGTARTAAEMRRLPDNIPNDLLGRVLPTIGIPDADVLGLPRIAALIRELRLDDFAQDLAAKVSDTHGALALVNDDHALRAAYRLLTLLWIDGEPTKAATILRDATILRNTDGSLVAPRRAQLPGGFRDPTGYYQFVDTAPFPAGMERFATEVLGITILHFPEYVERHLGDAIARGVNREQYRSIMAQIVAHRRELMPQRETLRQLAFVRTRGGDWARPDGCYYSTSALQSLLGDHAARWVDENWMPVDGLTAGRVRDILEIDLAMPTTVSTSHIIARVTEIAASLDPEQAMRALAPIMRHILDRWPRLDLAEREELGGLSEVMFMPAMIKGAIDTERLYYPEEVYRAIRAVGFDTQVPIVGLQALRLGDRSTGEFLDLLGVEQEPGTGVVVDHLLQLMKEERGPSDVTYAILSERLGRGDGPEEIDRLVGTPFIFDPTAGFLHAEAVFWTKPPFGGRWHQVSGKMRERQPLFTRLGVSDAPEPKHYARLLLQIADDDDRSDTDLTVHDRCLMRLAEDLDAETPGAAEAIDTLADEDCLLAIDANAMWPGDALWLDSEMHIAPFGHELDHMVVRPPEMDGKGLRRLFARLGARPLSDAVRIELSERPTSEVDIEATRILRERGDLLVRLIPTTGGADLLWRLVKGIEVRRAEMLLTRAELHGFGEPVRSAPIRSPAHLETAEPALYLQATRMGLHEWMVTAQHLLAGVAHLCPSADLRALAAVAHFALMLPTREQAEEAIEGHGYLARAPDDGILPEAEELEDGGFHDPAFDVAGDDTQDVETASDPTFEDVATDTESGPTGEPSGSSNGGTGDVNRGERSSGSQASSEPQDSAPATSSSAPYSSKPAAERDVSREGAGSSTGDAKREGDPADGGRRDGEDTLRHQNDGDLHRSARSASGERSERRRSRSRMRSYVSENAERADQAEATDDGRTEIDRLVDAAAVEAVLVFEAAGGRHAVEQHHGNPGYDVVSSSAQGPRRLIEVKGINGDWDGLGVKLSKVQYRCAQENPEEFWLYVVENALDPSRRHVRPLPDPFSRVDEYWFDGEWRKTCEAGASARDLHLKVGATVKDPRWGRGRIEALVGSGILQQARVRFDDLGLKIIPVNKLDLNL